MISNGSFNYHLAGLKPQERRELEGFLESLQGHKCAIDELDVKRPLLLVSTLEQYSELSLKFRYFINKTFVFISQGPKDLAPDDTLIFDDYKGDELKSFLNFYAHRVEKNRRDILSRVEGDTRSLSQLLLQFIDIINGNPRFLEKILRTLEEEDYDKMFRAVRELKNIYRYENFNDITTRYKGLVEFGIESIELFERMNDSSQQGSKRYILLPSPAKKTNEFIKFSLNKPIDPVLAFIIVVTYSELEKFCLRAHKELEKKHQETLWEEAFNLIDRPVGVFSSNGEVVICNPLFSALRMSPKTALSLEDEQTVEIDHKLYQVTSQNLPLGQGQSVFLYLEPLMAKKGHLGQFSSSELGIITSSLAHELNNPIGGVLAALSLLELEDDRSEDFLLSIEEMKQSARRCKNLIEIFLGFSRAYPSTGDESDIQGALNDALNLLRFRMIETGLRVEFDLYDKQMSFVRQLNRSSMSMIFYLTLSEVLTQFSQLQLLESPLDGQRLLKGHFGEYDHVLVMSFEENWSHGKSIASSKLLGHLLELQGLEVEQNLKTLKFHNSSLF